MVDPGKVYDLIVVGGGVVGLAVLRAATLQGWDCILVEANDELLSQASGSNSGIACTGVDATSGTLERALIRDANSQFRIYCREHNIPTRPCGSLVCCWPWDETNDKDDDTTQTSTNKKLHSVLEESHDAGDTHATLLSPKQVMETEPNLAKSCTGAVHIPGEIVIDPWVYSISLAVHARENGATIVTNFIVDATSCSFDENDRIWTINRRKDDLSKSSKNNFSTNLQQPTSIKARIVVNAAGLWSDNMQMNCIGIKQWTAKPRRGQYRIYKPNNSTCITHPIQPIPSQRTKGIFVFSTIYGQLVVGPTALDQNSKIDRSIDKNVAAQLDDVIQRIIPNIDVTNDYVGEYVGIRPGTDQRDYQIHSFPERQWISVAGIRSTGLTASLGIGDYVIRQLQCMMRSSMMTTTMTTQKEASKATTTTTKMIKTTPMPSTWTMMQQFHQTNGYVFIHGYKYKVTHPLTRYGWESFFVPTKQTRQGQAKEFVSKSNL